MRHALRNERDPPEPNNLLPYCTAGSVGCSTHLGYAVLAQESSVTASMWHGPVALGGHRASLLSAL